MIFQINYDTDAYTKYHMANQRVLRSGRFLFHTDMVEKFIDEFGYRKRWDNLKVKPGREHARIPILMDVFRLLVIYELGGIYIDSDVYFTDKINELEYDLWNKFLDRDVIVRTKSLFFIKGFQHSAFIEHLIKRYFDSPELDYDVKMLGAWNFSEFSENIAIIEPQFLDKYFTHEKVTTK